MRFPALRDSARIRFKHHARLAEGNDVIGARLHGLRFLGAFDLAPVKALVLQHHHGIRIVVSGFHQTFQISARAGVGHLDALDVA